MLYTASLLSLLALGARAIPAEVEPATEDVQFVEAVAEPFGNNGLAEFCSDSMQWMDQGALMGQYSWCFSQGKESTIFKLKQEGLSYWYKAAGWWRKGDYAETPAEWSYRVVINGYTFGSNGTTIGTDGSFAIDLGRRFVGTTRARILEYIQTGPELKHTMRRGSNVDTFSINLPEPDVEEEKPTPTPTPSSTSTSTSSSTTIPTTTSTPVVTSSSTPTTSEEVSSTTSSEVRSNTSGEVSSTTTHTSLTSAPVPHNATITTVTRTVDGTTTTCIEPVSTADYTAVPTKPVCNGECITVTTTVPGATFTVVCEAAACDTPVPVGCVGPACNTVPIPAIKPVLPAKAENHSVPANKPANGQNGQTPSMAAATHPQSPSKTAAPLNPTKAPVVTAGASALAWSAGCLVAAAVFAL